MPIPITPQGSAIVGGTEAEEGRWPFMARLFKSTQTYSDSSLLGFCDGTLIATQWVLTAGHCVTSLNEKIKVFIGTNDLTKYNRQEYIFEVEKTYYPFFYSAWWLDDYDIGLVKLNRNVPENIAKPIPLFQGEKIKTINEGSLALILGWGRQSYKGEVSSLLNYAVLPVISNKRVQNWTHEERKAKDFSDLYHLDMSVIYAGYPQGGTDSCNGDSGGPLLIWSEQNNRWEQAGVISRGHNCGLKFYPGIYTYISYSGIQKLGRDRGKNISIPSWISENIGSQAILGDNYYVGKKLDNDDVQVLKYSSKVCNPDEWGDEKLPAICPLNNYQ